MSPMTRTRATTPTLGDNRRLTFYPAVFDTPTTITQDPTPWGKIPYTEVVRPGAFTETLEAGGEVRATINHKEALTFAKRTTGELILQQDDHGLFATCYLPRNRLGDQVMRGVEEGMIHEASFMFYARRTNWVKDATPLCELLAVDLEDVCVALGEPAAYPGTEVHLRTAPDDRVREFFARLRLLKLKS